MNIEATMSENIHPGHKALREIIPEAAYRRLVVSALCEKMNEVTGEIEAVNVRRVCRIWQVECTVAQSELIADFINSI